MQSQNLPARQQSRDIATPSSPDLPALPAWLDESTLDARHFMSPVVPAGAEQQVLALAEAYEQAKQPATPQERMTILGKLRLRTIPRNESQDEALARFDYLVDDMAEYPADVLAEACNRYIRSGGSFFPTAGELLKHVNPLMFQRLNRAYNLSLLAKEAQRQIELEPDTPEKQAERRRLAERIGNGNPVLGVLEEAKRPAEQPTVEGYMAAGATREAAEAAIATLNARPRQAAEQQPTA